MLHAGLGPEDAFSGQIAKVIAFALEAAGAPIVKGGARNLLAAFEALIRERGGEIRTDADVASIVQADGRATGVRLASGETDFGGEERDLLGHADAALRAAARRREAGKTMPSAIKKYRYGKGNFQIHYALDKPPAWRGDGLGEVALLHLTPGLDGVSKACNEAARGMLPETPTICVGQPHALDPSRCPDGKAILWLQLPEAPRHIKGDAAGKLDVPADGKWTEALREAYADRVEAILASHIDGFKDSVIARRAYSPADLEAMNINLVGGDPYGGSSTIDQSFLWRPFKGSVNHETDDQGPLPYRRLDASGRGPRRRLRLPSGAEAVMDQKVPEKRQRISTLGQIGLQQFAPYLMNRIMGRYNATLRDDLRKQRPDHSAGAHAGRAVGHGRRHRQRPRGLYRHRAVDDEPHARRAGGARPGAARAGRGRQPRPQGFPDR